MNAYSVALRAPDGVIAWRLIQAEGLCPLYAANYYAGRGCDVVHLLPVPPFQETA